MFVNGSRSWPPAGLCLIFELRVALAGGLFFVPAFVLFAPGFGITHVFILERRLFPFFATFAEVLHHQKQTVQSLIELFFSDVEAHVDKFCNSG